MSLKTDITEPLIEMDLRGLSQRLLNRWTSQFDLECTTGGLERVVSVHNFGAPEIFNAS